MATADSPQETAAAPAAAAAAAAGCQHIQGLLANARDKATEGYMRLVGALLKDGGRGMSDRVYKNGDKIRSSGQTTYLCLQCPNVSTSRERHKKEHAFSVESRNGFIFCHECKDFVYDPTFEELRSHNSSNNNNNNSSNSKKRKASELLSGDGEQQRLISSHSSATPCAASGLRGLYNMGQTCFMSVILQSLVHNPLIRTFYLTEGHRSGSCEREACTSCALDDIFTDFYGLEKHEGYGAVHMLQGCWKGGGGLAGYSQQDAHEYLGFILNSLHSAITDEEEPESNSQKSEAIKDCDCVVHQTFGGLLKSTVTCSKCRNTTTANDPFMDLSLDVRSSAVSTKKKLAMINGTTTVKEVLPMDLSECLDRFTSTETLSADSYHCNKCASSQEATKRMSLSRLPPVIPIHLKRFSHSKTLATSTKVDTKIRFPFTVDFSPYCTHKAKVGGSRKNADKDGDKNAEKKDNDSSNNNNKDGEGDSSAHPDPVYELSSVIVHKGKIDNGHYISYSRQEDEWFRFDDSMVVQVDEKEVLGAEAYILVYVVREIKD